MLFYAFSHKLNRRTLAPFLSEAGQINTAIVKPGEPPVPPYWDRGDMNNRVTSVVVATMLLTACGRPQSPRLERIADQTELPAHALRSLTGYGDADVLHTKVILAADSSMLTLDLRFRIGVPTRLDEGSYLWQQTDTVLRGPVEQVSATFLGGQSGRASIGGTFDLLSPDGKRLFKVRIPVRQVAADR